MAASEPSLQSRGDLFEIEILPGLVPICEAELREVFAEDLEILHASSDSLIVALSREPSRLLQIRTAVAIYRLLYYKIPRPQMLAEGGHLRRLGEAIAELSSTGEFSGFRISAAGSDSTAFRRIRAAIAGQTGLDEKEDGQLLIRLRRSILKKVFGWEMLLRITPLPLSARSWRVSNMPGALNATIAAAMNRLTQLHPDDQYLNIACGSGTLLAERLLQGPVKMAAGIDVAGEALKMAQQNIQGKVLLAQGAGERMPFADATFDVITSDLPWGRLIGSRERLLELYGAVITEMTRISTWRARAVILTQENKLFDQALHAAGARWETLSTLRVMQSEYRPKMYVLKRRDN